MDGTQFESVYEAHAERVMRYCLFRSPSAADAEDIAAEAFARLLAADGRVREEDALPWLLKVARNLSVDDARRRRRDAGGLEGVEPVAEDVRPWLDEDVCTAVQRLTPDQQLALYLRVFEDLPFAEVGRLMRRREASAKMLVRRALKALERTLEER